MDDTGFWLAIYCTSSRTERVVSDKRSLIFAFIVIIITSTGDLQPSTATTNQLPGQ